MQRGGGAGLPNATGGPNVSGPQKADVVTSGLNSRIMDEVRPFGDIRQPVRMPRCGPSYQTFAARENI